jgi:3-carboxy-cis,cis-muconate cycloisomerase
VADVLVDLCLQHRDTVCVARTLTQQAMPTTLGFRIATWLAGVHDAIAAVRAVRPLPVSLGGPIGTAAAYGSDGPQVVAALASTLRLGAPVISWHSRRTPVLALAAALAAVGQACGRIAEDLMLLAQTEVAEASDGSAGRSSAMAHKANPTRSVLVASAARQLPGLLATVAASGASGSERPAGAWHAEWQPLRTMLRLAGAAAERSVDIAEQMTFDLGAMRRNLELLLSALDRDEAWAAEQTAHVGVWIDRVLAQREEMSGS